MPVQPKLTVCVPSRNRQRYFQETIRSLLVNMRMDVEFVLADNSDDPSIMNVFMEDIAGDPRVRYLPSPDKTLSMVDNWNRCLEAATGEFVCVIGDDDYVDIDVADVIARTQGQSGVDVFVWARLNYNWPVHSPKRCNVTVPLSSEIHKISRSTAYREFFSWHGDGSTPNMAIGIYHGAVSRKIMDKVKQAFGGRYFEYPTVDFDNICKVLVTAEHIFYSERCFSVLGVCPESNSARINSTEKMKELLDQFTRETGRNIDEDRHMQGFPFPSTLGLSASIAQTQNWFLKTYGYHAVPGWEANFASACGVNCGRMETRQSYETMVAGYELAFSSWQGGAFLDAFKPEPWAGATDRNMFTGVSKDRLYIDETIAGVRTPAELYHVVEQMIEHRDGLTINLTGQKAAA